MNVGISILKDVVRIVSVRWESYSLGDFGREDINTKELL